MASMTSRPMVVWAFMISIPGERAGLGEDAVRDAGFADVVFRRGDAEEPRISITMDLVWERRPRREFGLSIRGEDAAPTLARFMSPRGLGLGHRVFLCVLCALCFSVLRFRPLFAASQPLPQSGRGQCRKRPSRATMVR